MLLAAGQSSGSYTAEVYGNVGLVALLLPPAAGADYLVGSPAQARLLIRREYQEPVVSLDTVNGTGGGARVGESPGTRIHAGTPGGSGGKGGIVRETAPPVVREGDVATFQLTALPPPYVPLTVTLQEQQQSRYGRSERPRTVIMDVGQTVQEVAVAVPDDGQDDSGTVVSLSLQIGEGYSVAPQQDTATLEVVDSVLLSISAVTETIAEGEVAVFALTAAEPVSQGLTVNLSVTGTPSGLLADTQPGSVFLPPGASATMLSLNTVDDQQASAGGSIQVALLQGRGYDPYLNVARVEVSDGDPPTAQITRAVNEAILPYVALAVADETARAIQTRLDGALAGGDYDAAASYRGTANNAATGHPGITLTVQGQAASRYLLAQLRRAASSPNGLSYLSLPENFSLSFNTARPPAATQDKPDHMQGWQPNTQVAADAMPGSPGMPQEFRDKGWQPNTQAAADGMQGSPGTPQKFHAKPGRRALAGGQGPGSPGTPPKFRDKGWQPNSQVASAISHTQHHGPYGSSWQDGSQPGAPASSAPQAQQAAGGRVTLWGRAWHNALEVEDAVGFDGDIAGGMLGIDYAGLRPGLVVGLGLSNSRAETDFALDDYTGVHETDINSYHPYFGWQLPRGRIWGTLGVGSGEADITVEQRPADSYSSEVDLQSLALGGQLQLGQLGASRPGRRTSIGLIGSGVVSELEEDAANGLAVEAGRLRLGVELEHNRTLGTDRTTDRRGRPAGPP